MTKLLACGLLMALSAPSLGATTTDTPALDLVWLATCTALVLLMQAGFTLFETGLTRAKNTINVALKNISDLALACLVFALLGYGLMFGDSLGGWLGSSQFAMAGLDDPSELAFFAFQVVFAGTAATIISGAVAERMHFNGYLLIAVATVAFIYPLAGHWIWSADGWLAQKGFIDFAGSTVVHGVGGWLALAGAMVLGARRGRFDSSGKPQEIPGHSLVLACIGVFVLWFGWLGFNAGSTLEASSAIAGILVNTLLSAAAGAVACMLLSLLVRGQVQPEKVLNGIIAGLVAITAGCAVVGPMAAVVLGLGGGLVVYLGEALLLQWGIDDPVGAAPAHAFAGVWGTLALAFAAPVEKLAAGSAWAQFGVQMTGVASVAVWSLACGFLCFGLLRALGTCRVSAEAEEQGLNVAEHGARTVWLDTMQVMDDIVSSGDLRLRAPVELGTEAGTTALMFNRMLEAFQHSLGQLDSATRQLNSDAGDLQHNASAVNQAARLGSESSATLRDSVLEIALAIRNIAQRAEETATAASQVSTSVGDSERDLGSALADIVQLADKVEQLAVLVHHFDQHADSINLAVDAIQSIGERTNLLALNAAIEAARAGEHGRGFAVVAQEVRELSTQAQQSAGEIAEVVKLLQTDARNASSAMQENLQLARASAERAGSTRQSLREITSAVGMINSLNAEVAVAVQQQEQAANGASRDVSVLSELVDKLHQQADTAGEHSRSIAGLSTNLASLTARYQT